MMKYLFLVTVVSVAVRGQILSKEEINKLKELHETCMKESLVDKEVVDKAMKGEYVDDPKLKAQISCANKKLGFQSDSGDILEDTLIQKLVAKFPNEKMVTSAVKHCSQKKATPEETAFELIKCLHSFAPLSLDVTSVLM